MPDEVARAWLGEIRRAGFEAVRFAWAGPADRSQPHAYRSSGTHLPDRIQQHAEWRQPHSLGLAEHAGRFRHPAGGTLKLVPRAGKSARVACMLAAEVDSACRASSIPGIDSSSYFRTTP